MVDLESLTDDELLAKLREYNLPVIPVTAGTRKILIGRLKKAGASATVAPAAVAPSQPASRKEGKSPARSPARATKRKPENTVPDDDVVSRTLTDAEIEQMFAELGWAKPKITEKNRAVLQKKINHARARSRSSSQSRIISSTRFEDEDDENENDSMEVEEEEEENHVEIPVRRTSRLREKELLAPSPKKMKKVDKQPDSQPQTPIPGEVDGGYQYRHSTVTVVVNTTPAAQPEVTVQPPPKENDRLSYVPPHAAPRVSQPFIPSRTTGSVFASPTNIQTNVATDKISPSTSVFIRGQDVSPPPAVNGNGTSRPTYSFTDTRVPADRYPVSATTRQTSFYRSAAENTAPPPSQTVPSRIGESSTFKSTSYQSVTDSSKPQSVSATQTTIRDEDAAYIADLRARLFGRDAAATPSRTTATTTVPFSKLTPTSHNSPARTTITAERKTTPIAPRVFSTATTPARRSYFEEQASESEEAQTPPPAKLNTTFNSPAAYRFSTPGRTGFSKYLPSFFKSPSTVKTPPAHDLDGSSTDDEDEVEEPARKKIGVTKPVAKVETPIEPEVSAGVLWAKYLPHVCAAFFAVILYVYWQLGNAESGADAGESRSIILTIAVSVFWNVLVILLIGLVAWIVVKLRSYYISQKEEEDAEVVELVKRVISRLTEHAEACKREGHPEDSFLPIDHIRDELIPVEQKKKRNTVWKKVVACIEKDDSRIRKEELAYKGEEQNVWRWLPTVHTGSDRRERGWQGSAFNVAEGSVNTPPLKSPTPCLKIRHMFDPSREDPLSDWQKRVADDLLEKCCDAKIVHMALEPSSKDGVIYVKCLSKEDAKKVYKSVHGCWYGGKILVVKYVTVQRYHERFPMAASSKEVMRPTQSARLANRFHFGGSALED